jgi:hypothetical protein
MKRFPALSVAALVLLTVCGEPTGPGEPVLVGENPSNTSLEVITGANEPPAGADGVMPVVVRPVDAITNVMTFTQVDVSVYGQRQWKLRFLGPNGCTVDLTTPFFPGIYKVGATATADTPAFGQLNCPALGGTKTLVGEVIITYADVDHVDAVALLSMLVGNLKWVDSGTRRFGGGVNLVAHGPPPPEEELPAGSIVCPIVPTGFWCVTVGTATAPVKWKGIPKGPNGSYKNSGMGVCMTLNAATGISSFTMSGGIGGGTTSYTSKWGATVASTGVVSLANGSIMYIYTGAQDAQILLLNWNNSGNGSWVQGGWTKGC